MKDYFFSVLCASVACALASMIFSGTGSEKYVKYIAALVASVIIFTPVIIFLGENTEKLLTEVTEGSEESFSRSEGEKMMYSFLQEENKQALEDHFSEIIFKDTGIKVKSVSIIIEYDDDKPNIKKGEIILESGEDIKKVSQYMTDNFGDMEWTVS